MTDRILPPLRVKHVESPWYNHVVLMDDSGCAVVPSLQMVVASHELLRARVAAMEKIVEAAKRLVAKANVTVPCSEPNCPECDLIHAVRAHALDEEDGR